MDAPDGKKNVDKWIELINQFGLVNRLTANLATVVPDHGRRLLALERARETPAPKKKRRRK